MELLNTVEQIAAYSFCGVIIGIAGVLSYRLLLHPLSDYPGPLIAKLTDGRNGYYSLLRDLHLVSLRDHRKFGPVVRHGPNKLLFNTVKALHAQDIYDNDRVLKSHVYTVTVQSPGVCNSFNVIDPREHRAKRKILGQVINEGGMRIFEDTMIGQIDIFIKLIRSSCDGPEPVNLSTRLDYLTCDIVGLLSFGYHLRLQTNSDNRFMMRGMYYGNYFSNTRMQYYRLHQFRLGRIIQHLSKATLEKYKRLMEKMITERISNDNPLTHDLYAVASQANRDEETLGGNVRMSDIWSEAVVFFPAGAFSVSTATCALFFYLSRDKMRTAKLQKEIRSTFRNPAEIRSGQQLSSCHYLRACIDEALRIATPIPGTPWREVESTDSKPLIVDGHVVPAGTQIGVNAYAIHHTEEYFPNPYSFDPERWLASETPEQQLKAMREAFSPFSIGSRACTGKAMAYLETSLIMAKAIWHFDFELPAGPLGKVGGGQPGNSNGRHLPNEYQIHDVLSAAHDGPLLKFRLRGGIEDNLATDGLSFQ
ncbi:hypothetical protein PFICI_00367 [Pestalotiopsis fici W106-1]|uniref:Cytochrome P450 n=1 Tax=Pestalotiopsis fici (strain W106-1 / CGMCC3.15140) TaxID=1229662 RepID=W3XKJ5_PESFW|nr:uncharacterized protein PFICI_00367 [Pestalotiopsis fici W106-1]ETS86539.1 hypothetical protein PFICI_00367 [Pestalotiopsis fici W106-1]